MPYYKREGLVWLNCRAITCCLLKLCWCGEIEKTQKALNIWLTFKKGEKEAAKDLEN